MCVTLGERIKLLRSEKQMTLEYVAKKIGVSRATVFKYENGFIENVPQDKIEALARTFGVSEAYMVGWTDKRHGDGPDGAVGVILMDNDMFIKAYNVMSYQDRVILTDIFTRAYEKLKEQEKNSVQEV